MPSDPDHQGPRRIVLVHDWLVASRGGEAVLEHIARVVERDHQLVAILTMFDSGAAIGETTDRTPHVVPPLGRRPLALRARRWLLPIYPLIVMDLSRRLHTMFDERRFDLVISTSSAAVKAIRPPGGVPHLCYCHSPPRYVWARAKEYSGGLRGLALRAIAPLYRAWDRRTSSRVTQFLANSSHIAGEIRRCYGRDAQVLHPPVDTDFYHQDPAAPRGTRWLCVGALEPYKRFDLAIDAARAANRELDVVGEGSTLRELRADAKDDPRITFHGRVTRERLRDLYRSAAVLLFPQIEDFGIVAVEAMACGCPVAANALGGARDIVEPGVTGVLVDDPTAESLARAARDAEALAGDACARSAQRFSIRRFESQISDCIGAITGGEEETKKRPTAMEGRRDEETERRRDEETK